MINSGPQAELGGHRISFSGTENTSGKIQLSLTCIMSVITTHQWLLLQDPFQHVLVLTLDSCKKNCQEMIPRRKLKEKNYPISGLFTAGPRTLSKLSYIGIEPL